MIYVAVWNLRERKRDRKKMNLRQNHNVSSLLMELILIAVCIIVLTEGVSGKRQPPQLKAGKEKPALNKSRIVVLPSMQRRKNAAAVAFVTVVAKKRQESPSRLLCPTEYSMCSCDMSPDHINGGSRYYYDSDYNDVIRAKSGSQRVGKSATVQSIMIDCQSGTESGGSGSGGSRAGPHLAGAASPKTVVATLKEIPKLVRSGSGGLITSSDVAKNFKHITHLDLSRTAISFVPTDAFLV